MSSKRVLTSLSFDKKVLSRLDDESVEQRRSRSNLLEKILCERYGIDPDEREGLEIKHVNKT